MTTSFLSNQPAGGNAGLHLALAHPERTAPRTPVVIEDPAVRALERTVQRVARASVTVLILGETGAGKDVVAALLHEQSDRRDKPFLALNCAALPESLLESELFGYERGAYTGATASKAGLLEAADGGTVFLDEVGDLSPTLQAKLLRVIETLEVLRLGSTKARRVNVRFVAATNRDMERQVEQGLFRKDLYYRLNSIRLLVPPLRERPTDIEPLARHFLESACSRFGASELDFSPAALAALSAHTWPGNVRELRSAVERAVLLAQHHAIEPEDLGMPARLSVSPPAPTNCSPAPELAKSSVTERTSVVRALERCGGNQTQAAKLLGVSRRTLVRRMAQYDLPRPRAGGSAAFANGHFSTPLRSPRPVV